MRHPALRENPNAFDDLVSEQGYSFLAPVEPSILMVTLCAHTPSICDGTFTGTQLHLYNEGLNGTIPTELFQHTQLTDLGLDVNQLSGTVPTEIGLLTRLDALYLARNRLTGTVPTEIGRLTQLISLELYGNSLRGTLPTELNQIDPTVCYITTYQCLAMGLCHRGGMANTNAFTCPIPTLPEGCARNLARTAREECTPTAVEAATATAGASLTIIIVAAAAAVVVVTMALAALWCLCRRKGPAGKDSHSEGSDGKGGG